MLNEAAPIICYTLTGLAVYDMSLYLLRRLCAATKASMDIDWRLKNDAPLFDTAGNKVEVEEATARQSQLDAMLPPLNAHELLLFGATRKDGAPLARADFINSTSSMHGITTSSTGREDIAVVMTNVGTLTLGLVRNSEWCGINGASEEVAGVLRVLTDEARRQLVPCEDCGGLGGLHSVDCREVEDGVDMSTEDMLGKEVDETPVGEIWDDVKEEEGE